MANVTFEYVMSGSTGCKIYNKEFIEHPENKEEIHRLFKAINRKEHGYSILFNALTQSEAEMVKLNTHYRDVLHSIHADSGGLQMITLGLGITPENKRKIYDRQAKFSDVAMSFDEIPIVTTEKRAVMGVTSLRRFDRENLKDYAVRSADNLREQIDYFHSHGGNRAHPLAIIHGNDIESYIDFANYLFDALPLDMHNDVAGLSVSGQSIGEGVVEAVERAFATALLPHNYHNKFHLLGVGSISRILPYLALTRSGLFKEGMHMSYDSTTHSGGLVRREYIDRNLSRIKPGKGYNTHWERIYEDILKLFPWVKDNVPTPRDLFWAMELDKEGREGKRLLFLNATIGFLCGAIENFKNKIDECLSNTDTLIDIAEENGKQGRLMSNLITIRDRKDFDEWKRLYGRYYSSDRIKDTTIESSLAEFF